LLVRRSLKYSLGWISVAIAVLRPIWDLSSILLRHLIAIFSIQVKWLMIALLKKNYFDLKMRSHAISILMEVDCSILLLATPSCFLLYNRKESQGETVNLVAYFTLHFVFFYMSHWQSSQRNRQNLDCHLVG
jgi:hypothetical protein